MSQQYETKILYLLFVIWGSQKAVFIFLKIKKILKQPKNAEDDTHQI
jgi:hypothetical protein